MPFKNRGKFGLTLQLMLAVGVGPAFVATGRGQSLAIKPLTDESLHAAVAEGEKGGGERYLLDLMVSRLAQSIYLDYEGEASDAERVLRQIQDKPYSVTLLTPFARAVVAASEAKRRFSNSPQLSASSLNAEGVMVTVQAGTNFSAAGIIQGLVIKKGDSVIRPAKTEITPTTIQNRLGASRPSAEARFFFSLESIPSFPFTLVCIGAAENFELTVVKRDFDPLPPLSEATNSVRRVGRDIPEPRKLKDVRPVYPAVARAARIQGFVEVEVTIGSDGKVESAKVVRSIPLLDQAALDAVRQWEFASAIVNGAPVSVIMTVRVDFNLP